MFDQLSYGEAVGWTALVFMTVVLAVGITGALYFLLRGGVRLVGNVTARTWPTRQHSGSYVGRRHP